MAEKGSVHPISKKSLEKHLQKVDENLDWIRRGDSTEKTSLFELMKGIGTSKNMMAKEVNDSMEAIRQGFSLYYEMHAVLEDRIKEINSGIGEAEKKLFLNAYSMFAAGSFIWHEFDLLSGEEAPFEFKKEDFKEFKFDESKDDTLNMVLARYYGLVSIGKRNDKLEKGIDLPRWSSYFFKTLKESALEKKSSFNPKLVDLVKDAQFRVADEFTITGFEAGHEEKVKTKIEFVSMEPYQIAGNVLAKIEMLRDMDRIALFDLITQKNPIIDVGGLSWSVLYDGLPGTGKSSLFRMGLTRLKKRCEQVSQFYKSKNLGELKWTQIAIDQGVKDEYYGKTGKNLLEKLNLTRKPDGIYIITTDDIDLLVAGDRSSSSGGADKDILNIFMQYADGINTLIRGNVQWWAATNDATSMDPALRQRFIARYSVDGPQEWYDFSDILYDKLKAWIKLGEIIKVDLGKDYKPYEMRKGQTGYEASKEEKTFFEKVSGKIKGDMTFKDIGELCKEMKEKNPRFTGRAVHAVAEAVKKRINDYEIPEEWYEKPEIFLAQDYTARVKMLSKQCKEVNGEMIAQEFQRYFESEQRYATDKFESDVGRYIHGTKVQIEAVSRLKQEGDGKE